MTMLDTVRSLMRPLSVRVSNMVARATVSLVTNDGQCQRVQLGALEGETIDDAEYFQPYGFTSVPDTGSEAAVIFPNGDRGHPIVVAIMNRGTRPTGHEPGEVAVYHKDGAMIRLRENGDIEITAKAGAQVLIHDGAGGYEPLVKKSEFVAHTHPTGVGPSGAPTVPITGTSTLQAK